MSLPRLTKKDKGIIIRGLSRSFKSKKVSFSVLDVYEKSKNRIFLCSAIELNKKSQAKSKLFTYQKGKEIQITSEKKLKGLSWDGFTPISYPILPWGKKGIQIKPDYNDLILNQCDRFGEKICVTIPKYPKRRLDLYFAVDTTGSMRSVVNLVQTAISGIVSTINSTTGIDLRVGLGNYKDFQTIGGPDPYVFNNDLSISPVNLGTINSLTSGWSISGGGDGPEGQLFALDSVASNPGIGWRTNSKKIILYIGDNPGHDPICNSVSGVGYNITTSSVIAKLLSKNISVIPLSVGGNGLDGSHSSGYPGCPNPLISNQATQIANQTGGTHLTNINVSNVTNQILGLLSSWVSTLGNVSLVPKGGISNFICAIHPKNGYNNLPTHKPHKLVFTVCFKGKYPCGKRDRIFKGSLDLIIDGKISARKKVIIEVPKCKSKNKCCCCGC